MFTSSPSASSKTIRWILLLPVLMVGSMLYWSVALGLGGLSLMGACATMSVQVDPTARFVPSTEALDVADGTTSIMVHLEESVEPEDVNDNAGAAGFTAPTDDQVTVTPGPGATSY